MEFQEIAKECGVGSGGGLGCPEGCQRGGDGLVKVPLIDATRAGKLKAVQSEGFRRPCTHIFLSLLA